MKKSHHHAKEQIAFALRQAEQGTLVAEGDPVKQSEEDNRRLR